jgi:hypothetical protein
LKLKRKESANLSKIERKMFFEAQALFGLAKSGEAKELGFMDANPTFIFKRKQGKTKVLFQISSPTIFHFNSHFCADHSSFSFIAVYKLIHSVRALILALHLS